MSVAIYHEAEARYPYKHSTGYDHLAWAKRIIYRNEHGDKSLLLCQIKCAYEAMNQPVPR